MPFWRTVTTSNGTEEKIWTFSARELQPGDILISEYNTRLITKVVPYTEFGDEYTAVVHSVSMTNMKQTSVALVFFHAHKIIRDGNEIYDSLTTWLKEHAT